MPCILDDLCDCEDVVEGSVEQRFSGDSWGKWTSMGCKPLLNWRVVVGYYMVGQVDFWGRGCFVQPRAIESRRDSSLQ